MPPNDSDDGSKIRNALGDTRIHAEADEQVSDGEESRLSSSTYTISHRYTHDLPASDVRGYIYSKWARSLRYENDFFKLVESGAFWKIYQKLITAILAKPETMLSLAVITDDPDVILGFSISRGNVLDYVYVHKHQRRLGIGARLVPDHVDTITHLTRTGMTIWGNKYGHFKFNPFA